MMKLTKLHSVLLLSIVMLCGNLSMAQSAKIRKADAAFQRLAYTEAREIYLSEVENEKYTPLLLLKLADTYYMVGDYANAAKWFQFKLETFPEHVMQPAYYFKASQSFRSENNIALSDSLMTIYTTIREETLLTQNFKEDFHHRNLDTKRTSLYEIKRLDINSSYSDITPSYYINQIVFASAAPRDEESKERIHNWNAQPYLNLYMANIDIDGDFYNIRKLKGDLATPMHESSATFTEDGMTVYFTRNNYIDGKKGKDREQNIRLKVYKATRTAHDFWSNVEELPFNSAYYSVSHPSLSPDEKRLYFSSDMPGTYGLSDIWYVDIFEDGTFGIPVNLGPNLNTEARDTFPFVSKDNILYFSSVGRPGLGGLDIFYTKLNEEGLPTEIYAMPEPINSPFDDFTFIIDTETRTGYFASNRASEPGTNNDDIFYFSEICETTITGVITDKKTGEILEGSYVVITHQGNEIESVYVGADGVYEFVLPCDETSYVIQVEKVEYIPESEIVETPEAPVVIEAPIALEPVYVDPCGDDLGCRLKLNPIYFDYDKHNIRPDAAIELTKVLNALLENPQMNIHIESHTDSRGNDDYNMALSDRRAKSTREWLIEKGIAPNRLTAKGYGESRLLNECGNNVRCSEEKHQLNRRSVFTIVQE
jgi:outer membrane protein OmpA-like peptidoglycan-associated protein